jgi:hypothetical protein
MRFGVRLAPGQVAQSWYVIQIRVLCGRHVFAAMAFELPGTW